jgi:hypothetical protein
MSTFITKSMIFVLEVAVKLGVGKLRKKVYVLMSAELQQLQLSAHFASG